MTARSLGWLMTSVRSTIGRIIEDRRGIIAPVYALLFVTMMMALGAGIDISNALQVKYQLDLAADAAAVACGETWQSYMEAGAGATNTTTQQTNLLNNSNTAAQTAGVNAFLAQAGLLGVQGQTKPTLTYPTILAANSPVVTATETAGVPNVVNCAVTYTASNLDYLMQIAGFYSQTVNGQATTQVQLAPYVAVYLIVDTSASMMVGSNIETQKAVSDWMGYSVAASTKQNPNPTLANYAMVFNDLKAGQTPCGFACHDDSQGGPATTSVEMMLNNMELGEQVAAYEAGQNPNLSIATRFDVMRAALVNDPNPPTGDTPFCTNPGSSPAPAPTFTAGTDWSGTPPPVICSSLGEGLLASIRAANSAANARTSLNTFTYSLYGFNEGINGNSEPYKFDIAGDIDYSQYAVPPVKGKVNQTTNPFGVKDVATVAAGVNSLMVGMNTHLNDTVLPALVNIVGSSNGNCAPAPMGSCAADPLRFVIIITDGLMSDRDFDWQQASYQDFTGNCNTWNGTKVPFYLGTTTPEWHGGAQCNNLYYVPGFMGTQYTTTPIWPSSYNFKWSSTFRHSNYAQAIAATGTNSCATLKANNNKAGYGTLPGVIVAVLETPYIPMNGQQPNTFPYEENAQWTIYPGGPGTTSALSTALSACATQTSIPNEFYFQATADTQISTGFAQLFKNYISEWVHLTK